MARTSELSNEMLEAILNQRRARAESRPSGDGEHPETAKEVTSFDPRKPCRLNKKQIGKLSGLFHEMAEGLAVAFEKQLRTDVEVRVKEVTQERCESFGETMSDPVCLYQVACPPMELPVWILVKHALLFAMVDRFLGGSGEVEIKPRALTPVERSIADRMLHAVMEAFAEVWKQIEPVTPAVGECFTEREKFQGSVVGDVILLAVLEVAAEVHYGEMVIGLPFTAIEPYIDQIEMLAEVERRENLDLHEWKARLERKLYKVQVGIPMVLGSAEIPISEFLDLKEEDVIVLGKPITEPVEMQVGSEAVIEGNIGRHNGRLAMKVLDIRKLSGDAEEVEKTHG